MLDLFKIVRWGAALEDRFVTTRWSAVLAAARGEEGVEEALEWLCETYWYPLYGFVRHRGYDAETARDLTQSFFVTVLDPKKLQRVDPGRGRFRAYLLASMKNFLAHETERVGALKRRFENPAFRADSEGAERRFLEEPAAGLSPEEMYESRWARTVLDRALRRLDEEHATTGRGELFRQLAGHLTGDEVPYERLAAALGMTEGAVRVAVHRLRQRLGELLREEVVQTVAAVNDVDDEIRELLRAVARCP